MFEVKTFQLKRWLSYELYYNKKPPVLSLKRCFKSRSFCWLYAMNSCFVSNHPIHVNLVFKAPNCQIDCCMMSPSMRDRSKNRKPLQRGRISKEAIQAVQALKRSKGDEILLQRVLESKVRRLVKIDLMAVLQDLHRQEEPLLALQVFEGIRAEFWYKPKVFLYAEMVRTLALSEKSEEVLLVISWLKKESYLDPGDVEGFNSLLGVLVEFKYVQFAMECFHLMKVVGCELQETTFRILVDGFKALNQMALSDMIRQEYMDYFGKAAYFSDEEVSSLNC